MLNTDEGLTITNKADELILEIRSQLYDQITEDLQSLIAKDDFFKYLRCSSFIKETSNPTEILREKVNIDAVVMLSDYLEKNSINLTKLNFNAENLQLSITYGELESAILNILNTYKWINFKECTFDLQDFPHLPFFYTFHNCLFTETLHLNLSNLKFDEFIELQANSSILFNFCTFNKSLIINGEQTDERLLNLFSIIIQHCKFEKLFVRKIKIENTFLYYKDFATLFEKVETTSSHIIAPQVDIGIKLIDFKDVIFNSTQDFSWINTDEILFSECQFLTKIISNRIIAERYQIFNCEFNSSINIEAVEVKELLIFQANFDHFFSVSNSTFNKLFLSSTSFKYTVDFSEAQIDQNLTLHSSLFNQSPNFLATKFSKKALKNIDRETFRIIKHSFQSIGNNIEANKYYAYEMEAYRRYLKNSKDNEQGTRRERVLLGFNALISKHGQDYVRASFWLIFCMAITAFVVANDESQWIRTYFDMPNWWVNVCNIANGLALGFLPLSGLYDGREHLAFFLMLSTIAISTTSWHLLVAIRRHSKR